MKLKTVSTGAGILCLIILIAGAEYWFKEKNNPNFKAPENTVVNTPSPIPPSSSLASSGVTVTSSKPDTGGTIATDPQTAVKKGMSLKKYSGPSVDQILSSQNLVPTVTKEASLLNLSSGTETSVLTVVLLKNNDRAALFSWVETPDVKTLFSALKQALQEQFSPGVKGLTDELRNQPNGPSYDYLSFTDPAISPEKVIFIRVRTRLYEFHIVSGQEDTVDKLIAELCK